MSFLHQMGSVKGPQEVNTYVKSQESDDVDPFHVFIWRGGMGDLFGSPEVHDDCFDVSGVQDQIAVCVPLNLMFVLLPVVCLHVVRYESHYIAVIRKLHYNIRGVGRGAIMGEYSEVGWIEHITLWRACV